MKKNFKCDDQVRIHSTCSEELDGQVCTVLGLSHSNITDTYIILLDKPVMSASVYDDFMRTHKAITLTEACLELV